jgi:hypothetical protein
MGAHTEKMEDYLMYSIKTISIVLLMGVAPVMATTTFNSKESLAKHKVVRARLARRMAISRVKADNMRREIEACQKNIENAQQEAQHPRSLFRKLSSDADRQQAIADAHYALAKKQLEAEQLKLESEARIEESQKYLEKIERTNAKEAVVNQQRHEHEYAMKHDPEYAERITLLETQQRMWCAKASLITAGGALLVYALWQSRAWEGWSHLKSYEFRKFGTSLRNAFAYYAGIQEPKKNQVLHIVTAASKKKKNRS